MVGINCTIKGREIGAFIFGGKRMTKIALDDDVELAVKIPFEQCPPLLAEDLDDLPESYPVSELRGYVACYLDSGEPPEPDTSVIHHLEPEDCRRYMQKRLESLAAQLTPQGSDS